jgi:hypothetical protein
VTWWLSDASCRVHSLRAAATTPAAEQMPQGGKKRKRSDASPPEGTASSARKKRPVPDVWDNEDGMYIPDPSQPRIPVAGPSNVPAGISPLRKRTHKPLYKPASFSAHPS